MINYFLRRYFIFPLKYALSGLKFALHDRSFQFEIILGLIFYPLLIAIFHFSWKLLLLSMGYFSILITEIVNCAIEKIVDLISPQINVLAKQAKDIASGAVLLAVCHFFMILLYCFFA